MPFDPVALAKKCSVWSGDAVVVAAAATRLYGSYQKLESSAKAAIMADVQAVEAAWLALDASLDSYDHANKLSKLSALIAVFDTVAKTAPLLTRIARDGQTLFQADWPVIKPDVETILNTLQGQSA